MFRFKAWVSLSYKVIFGGNKTLGDTLRQKWERRDSDHPSLTLSLLIRALPETEGLTVTVQIGLCPLSLELCRCSTGFKRANSRDNLCLSRGKVYWLELDLPLLGENRTVCWCKSARQWIRHKCILFSSRISIMFEITSNDHALS